MYKLNNMRYLLLCLTFLLATATPVSASESDGIDVKEIVLGHLADAYEWHITTSGGKHISIPCYRRGSQPTSYRGPGRT